MITYLDDHWRWQVTGSIISLCTARVEKWEPTSEVEVDPSLVKMIERGSPTLIADSEVHGGKLKMKWQDKSVREGELIKPVREGEVVTSVEEETLAPAWEGEVLIIETEDGGVVDTSEINVLDKIKNVAHFVKLYSSWSMTWTAP